MLHIFFNCKFATNCWNTVGLRFDMQMVESASNWLLEKIIMKNSGTVEKIVIVVRSICFARNQWIWESKTINPMITVNISRRNSRLVWNEKEGKQYCLQGDSRVQTSLTRKHFQKDCFNLNVNASVFSNDSSFSISMVIRNDQWHYVHGKNMCILGMVCNGCRSSRGSRSY